MITFLNALLLTGLAAALIPILIHLLNRQKSKVIPFSTLDFLKVLQKKKMKRLKLRQILLLILRTLVLVLIVLAFARPTMTGYLSSGIDAHTATSVAIVLDNTLSTGAQESEGIVFEQEKRKALEIIQFLKEGDDAILLLPSDPPEFVTAGATRNFTELSIMTRDLDAGFASTDLPAAIEEAIRLLQQTKALNKEIHVITDLQKTGFKDIQRKIDLAGTKLFFVDSRTSEVENVAVLETTVQSRIIQKNKPVDVTARIKNFGSASVSDFLVQIYLDGKRSGQATLDLESNEEREVAFKIVPDRYGFLEGYVETEDDALIGDNRRFFNLYAPDKINVLLVGASSDTRFLRLALDPGKDVQSNIVTTAVPAKQMSTTNFGIFDALIFSNIPRFDDVDITRIKDYLANGGGVLFLPGDAVDISNFNQRVLATFNFPPVSGAFGSTGSRDNFLSFGKIDFEHPIFNGMFEGAERKIDSPKFYYSLIAGSGGSRSSAVISFSNDRSFLEESTLAGGKVMMCTSSPDFKWSDLAVKGIFVPMMHRLVYYLAAKSKLGGLETMIGKHIEFQLEHVNIGENLKVQKPNEVEVFVKPEIVGSSVFLTFAGTDLPGPYRVWNQEQIVNSFTVNTKPEESDLTPVAEDELDEVFGAGNYRIVDIGEDAESFILQSRYGQELWKWAIILAVLLLVAEMLIARENRAPEEQP